jgi:hypothetical protein
VPGKLDELCQVLDALILERDDALEGLLAEGACAQQQCHDGEDRPAATRLDRVQVDLRRKVTSSGPRSCAA